MKISFYIIHITQKNILMSHRNVDFFQGKSIYIVVCYISLNWMRKNEMKKKTSY